MVRSALPPTCPAFHAYRAPGSHVLACPTYACGCLLPLPFDTWREVFVPAITSCATGWGCSATGSNGSYPQQKKGLLHTFLWPYRRDRTFLGPLPHLPLVSSVPDLGQPGLCLYSGPQCG